MLQKIDQQSLLTLFNSGNYKAMRKLCKGINSPEILRLVGLSFYREGENKLAIRSYKEALRLNPTQFESLLEVYAISGLKEYLSKLLKHYDHATVYLKLAMFFAEQKKFIEAYPYFSKHYGVTGDNQYLMNLCRTFNLPEYENIEYILKIGREIKYVDAIAHVGTIYEVKFYDLDKALSLYEEALLLDPSNKIIINNIGNVLLSQNNIDGAREQFKKCFDIDPKYHSLYTNMSNLESYINNYDKAIEYITKAYEYGESADNYYCSMGVNKTHQGFLDEGIVYFKKALEVNPNKEEALNNYAITLLLNGNLEEGFKYYDYRPSRMKSHFPKTEWSGEHGGTILLISEQGLGDVLQFCRYIPMVKKIAKKVILVCPKELISLLHESNLGIDEYVILDSNKLDLPDYDYYALLLTLPKIFKTNLNNIMSDQYLFPVAAKVDYWKNKLDQYSGLKVGLVWTGNPRKNQIHNNSIDQRRSMKLCQFESLFDIDGITFFSLQKFDDLNQIEEYSNVINFMDEINDFSDTAALTYSLDLLITVDTSMCHLAGALHKQVWMLSRFDNCWRWLKNRSDSPWYPTMKIFTQPEMYDWDSVVENVRLELINKINQ